MSRSLFNLTYAQTFVGQVSRCMRIVGPLGGYWPSWTEKNQMAMDQDCKISMNHHEPGEFQKTKTIFPVKKTCLQHHLGRSAHHVGDGHEIPSSSQVSQGQGAFLSWGQLRQSWDFPKLGWFPRGTFSRPGGASTAAGALSRQHRRGRWQQKLTSRRFKGWRCGFSISMFDLNVMLQNVDLHSEVPLK